METPAPDTTQITIVEGPPPDFAQTEQEWVLSLADSRHPFVVAYCQVRAFDASQLIDRCLRAWRGCESIVLDYPNPYGTRSQNEIIAARAERWPEGDVLNLWVKVPLAE